MVVKYVFLSLIWALLVACQQDNVISESSNEAETLAIVNKQVITKTDIDVIVNKISANPIVNVLDKTVNENALESIIMMMVIAQESEKTIGQEDLAEIESKTRRYREELLAEKFLRKNSEVIPPTTQEISEYYQNNQALFKKDDIKHFEFVTTTTRPASQNIQAYLRDLSALNENNWGSKIASLKIQKEKYSVITSNSNIPGLDQSILKSIESLAQGEVSKVTIIDGKPYIFMVSKVLNTDVASLDSVRNEIRKTLAVAKLKGQLKEISQRLVEKAEINYINE